MSRSQDEPLQDQAVVPEGRLGFASGRCERRGDFVERPHRPHSLCRRRRRGLHEEGRPDLGRRGHSAPRPTGRHRRNPAGSSRRGRERAAARPPCRPSPGSRRATARSSECRPRGPLPRTEHSQRGTQSRGGGRPRRLPVQPRRRSRCRAGRWRRGRSSGESRCGFRADPPSLRSGRRSHRGSPRRSFGWKSSLGSRRARTARDDPPA